MLQLTTRNGLIKSKVHNISISEFIPHFRGKKYEPSIKSIPKELSFLWCTLERLRLRNKKLLKIELEIFRILYGTTEFLGF